MPPSRALATVPMDRFSQLARAYETANKRVQAVKAHTEEIVEHAVHTAEVGAAAFTIGAARGYFGPIDVLGVPAELGLSLLAHGGAIMMADSKAAPHLRAVGDAALAAFAYGHGMDTGKQWKDKAGKGSGSTPSVKGDTGSGGGLSPEERAEIDARK